MFAVGQEVSTKYGLGTVVGVGTVNPHVRSAYIQARTYSF